MKTKRILTLVLVFNILLTALFVPAFAQEGADPGVIAVIDGAEYTDFDKALLAVKDGQTIELKRGTFELGKVVLPERLNGVTIKGAPDKTTVIKNSSIVASDVPAMNYTDVTLDTIVFDNTYIALQGKGTCEAVFKNWTVTGCVFRNIVTPDKNIPAFAYTQKAVLEKMNGFTFTHNVVENVSGGLNAGLKISSADGKIVIADNVFVNLTWNAIQLNRISEYPVNDLSDPPVVEITNNIISGIGADEGMVNLSGVRCAVNFAGNTLTRCINLQPYLCYVKTELNMSDNVWIDENGTKVSDEDAKHGIFVIEKDAEIEKAKKRLKSFGIAKGISEKDFGENLPVTREQMAAFVYRFVNKGQSLEDADNDTAFTDLSYPMFHGMISWASREGIIKGTSETTFEPTKAVTLQDCYAMVLRALGYKDVSYPDGYIELANKLRLSENVKATQNTDELNRGDTAIILYNALFAGMKDGGNAAVNIYGRHPLDGKKVLFVGNSWTFHGHTVFRKSRTVLNIESRRNDTAYFYQLAKTNGAEPQVTNWTWGGHALMDIFNKECTSARECRGLDHLTNFTDYDYDYVFLQEGTKQSADTVKKVADMFKEANPEVKIFVLVPAGSPFGEKDTTDYTAALKALGYTVINWGKLVADIANGRVDVPGATQEYNKNSFIVALSAEDGHHPNVLTGYITALMSYCAITGESAVGQEYAFCSDKKLSSEFDFDIYEKTYYVYDNATTNFPEIFASESDMKGIQTLADEYLAK